MALEKGGKRRTGGWAKALPDIEWFVKRQSEVAKARGKKLFLHGFSMVRQRGRGRGRDTDWVNHREEEKSSRLSLALPPHLPPRPFHCSPA